MNQRRKKNALPRATPHELLALEATGFTVAKVTGLGGSPVKPTAWQLTDPNGDLVMVGPHGHQSPTQYEAVQEGLARAGADGLLPTWYKPWLAQAVRDTPRGYDYTRAVLIELDAAMGAKVSHLSGPVEIGYHVAMDQARDLVREALATLPTT